MRLHAAARPALSHRARSATVRVHGLAEDPDHAKPSALPELYLLVASIATCLLRLEELFLVLAEAWYDDMAAPSILAPLAGAHSLATLSVAYPGCADITIFQASLGHWLDALGAFSRNT